MSTQYSVLGKKTTYKSSYDPYLLEPIPRATNRSALGITQALPFKGMDIWNAYEFSWLNEKGKPEVALAEFSFPCTSPNIIESKTFKLYLNSFNQTRLTSQAIVRNFLQRDLSFATKAKVEVKLLSADHPITTKPLEGLCLDKLDINIENYHPQPELLFTHSETVKETVYSNLLKSNCPITHQPDWASIIVSYQGPQINHENLLKYIISFRKHQNFHEHCIERIFIDIWQRCHPVELTVYARYTRRGGLDINPFRSTLTIAPKNIRQSRQ